MDSAFEFISGLITTLADTCQWLISAKVEIPLGLVGGGMVEIPMYGVVGVGFLSLLLIKWVASWVTG